MKVKGANVAVYNLINLGRHLVSAKNYRYFRLRAFVPWENAVSLYKSFFFIYRHQKTKSCFTMDFDEMYS